MALMANLFIVWAILVIFSLFFFLRKDSILYESESGKFKTLMVSEMWQPYYSSGLALTIGLSIMLIGKLYQKNRLVIIVGGITIAAYHYIMKVKGFL